MPVDLDVRPKEGGALGRKPASDTLTDPLAAGGLADPLSTPAKAETASSGGSGMTRKQVESNFRAWLPDALKCGKSARATKLAAYPEEFMAMVDGLVREGTLKLETLDKPGMEQLRANFSWSHKDLSVRGKDEDIHVAMGEFAVGTIGEMKGGLKTEGLGPCVGLGLRAVSPEGKERVALAHLDAGCDAKGIMDQMLAETTGGAEDWAVTAEIAGGQVNRASEKMSGTELRAFVVSHMSGKVKSVIEHKTGTGEGEAAARDAVVGVRTVGRGLRQMF